MSVKMGWFHVVFISLCVFKGTWPFQWTSDHIGVVNLSSGQDLHLPWSFTLSDGQQVAAIQWYFRGQSEEMVAMVSFHGDFIPMPSFGNRVEFVPPAGLVVKNVVPSDSGNYTVEVVSHGGPNNFPDQRLTVIVEVTDPCVNHTVLDDAWRDVNQGFVQTFRHCDHYLTEGWYRFLLNGTNAVMPTSCVTRWHCNTNSPIWLDLEGRPMPDLGQQTTGRAYGSQAADISNTGGCRHYQNTSVTVLNCGAFYVYHLVPANPCHIAYCATVAN